MSRPDRSFRHHRLDAYRVSLDLLQLVHRLARGIPRGHRSLADQLQRAVTSVSLNIGEGAHRLTAAQQRACFVIARGEVGETAVALEIVGLLDLAPAPDVREGLGLADRVSAMLTRLIQRHGG